MHHCVRASHVHNNPAPTSYFPNLLSPPPNLAFCAQKARYCMPTPTTQRDHVETVKRLTCASSAHVSTPCLNLSTPRGHDGASSRKGPKSPKYNVAGQSDTRESMHAMARPPCSQRAGRISIVLAKKSRPHGDLLYGLHGVQKTWRPCQEEAPEDRDHRSRDVCRYTIIRMVGYSTCKRAYAHRRGGGCLEVRGGR